MEFDFSGNQWEVIPEDVKSKILHTSFFSRTISLNLSRNRLQEIPFWFKNIPFHHLSLCENEIETIPSWFYQMSVITLDLSKNQIQDVSYLEFLPMVRTLNLSFNRIKNVDCLFSSHLVNLHILNLKHNHIQSLPESYKYPRVLHLDNNHLTSLPMNFGLFGLAHVDLSNNPFPEFPDALKRRHSFETFRYNHNGLKEIPKWIYWYHKLKRLHLRGNHLTTLPQELRHLPLSCLYIDKNEFTEFPAVLRECTQLKALKIGYNHIMNFPPWFCEMKQLRTLGIEKNHFFSIPSYIDDFPDLKYFTFAYNPIGRLTERQKELLTSTIPLDDFITRKEEGERLEYDDYKDLNKDPRKKEYKRNYDFYDVCSQIRLHTKVLFDPRWKDENHFGVDVRGEMIENYECLKNYLK